jgi:excisionase family DNA binding protein
MGNPKRPVAPRTTLRIPDEAAANLGISRDAFYAHVYDHLKVIRVGRLRLVEVSELARWARENAARTLADEQ